MKKALKIILLLILVCVLFGGCGTDIKNLELKNRIIIQGVGIDKGENGLSVSFQVLNTDVSSNPNSGSAPSDVVKYYTVEAPSISQALDELSEETGMRPMISQNRIVVFGSELAKDGVGAYLDEFVRDAESRETILIAVAAEKAEDIIYANLGESVIPARKTEQIIEASEINFNIACVKAYEFINTVGDSALSGILPVLEIEKGEGEDEDKISVSSTAVFTEDKMTASVDGEITSGILWVTDGVKKGKFTFMTDGGYNVTADIIKSNTKIKTEIVNGQAHFTIKVSCSVTCSEIGDGVFNKKTTQDIEKISQNAENAVKNYIENSIKECIMEKEADVFGFSSRLKRLEPTFYKSSVTSWREQMKNCVYSVEADVKIKRAGGSAAALNGKD